jgi:hypothetical protein
LACLRAEKHIHAVIIIYLGGTQYGRGCQAGPVFKDAV